MWALPPGWRKWTKRRWPLLAVGAAVAVLSLDMAMHVLKDVAGLVLPAHAPAHPAAMIQASATIPRPAASPTEALQPAAVLTPAPPHTAMDGPFVVRSILPISGAIPFGKYYWDESKGEPGPLVVTVDLTARVLSVFENGHEVGATAILKGYGDKKTPLGVFPITQKDEHHISNIFNVPMPYMMRLTNDGVSIHSSKVERGYATNGCIGVPDGFAAKLFAKAQVGDRVIITDGKQLKLGDPIINAPKT
ncbi:L,D-transpeptidase family protein [Novosphingobium sp.]|uniref:L,D-transpeptidase family protein n=1 Tax=Novosphingobium sp. TaxID=1874826 RepID=UPI003D11BF5F